jgi:hypothetical protein
LLPRCASEPMRHFVLGLAIVYTALACWAVLDVGRTYGPYERVTLETALPVVFGAGLVPLLSAWVGAELARALRRPALLVRPAVRLRRTVLGLAAAGLSTVPMVAGMTWATDDIPDALVTGVGAGLAGFVAVIVLPRQRRGTCRGCGYDLSSMPAPGQPGFGLCPECGAGVMAGGV